MEAHKISVKFYVQDAASLSDAEFVPILHTWIQAHAIADHSLIDVADYSHVHEGPGTVLIGHEANFYLDRIDAALGLTYSRKQPLSDAASFEDRLRQAFTAALAACERLEQEPALAGRIKFRTDEAAVFINDRLLAPNTPQTFAQVRPDLQRVASQLYPGGNIDIEHYQSELTLFEVHLRADQSPDIATLLNRLGAAATAPSQ